MGVCAPCSVPMDFRKIRDCLVFSLDPKVAHCQSEWKKDANS